MSKIYRVISSFTNEQSQIGLKQFSEYELNGIIDWLDKIPMYTFKYDGKVCHWREGDLEYNVMFCDEKDIEKIKNYDEIVHNGMEGYTQIDDITTDVLLDRFDTKFVVNFNSLNQLLFIFKSNKQTCDLSIPCICVISISNLTFINVEQFFNT
jgi:hypothetical protein